MQGEGTTRRLPHSLDLRKATALKSRKRVKSQRVWSDEDIGGW